MGTYFIIGGVVAVLGFLVWWGVRERKAGAATVENKVLTKTTEVQQKQLDAANKRRGDKEAVVDRLRREGL